MEEEFVNDLEEQMMREMEEESIDSKIAGHQAQIDQMKRMIEENERIIAEEGPNPDRSNMIKVLNEAIKNELAEIEQLNAESTDDDTNTEEE